MGSLLHPAGPNDPRVDLVRSRLPRHVRLRAPSVHRGLSAQVISYRDHRFLVDCGEGTQRQILRSGIGFRRMNRILITHGHLDHILGLAGLLSTFSRWEAIDRLEIWAGRGPLERIHDLLYGSFSAGGPPAAQDRPGAGRGRPPDGRRRLQAHSHPCLSPGPGLFWLRFRGEPRDGHSWPRKPRRSAFPPAPSAGIWSTAKRLCSPTAASIRPDDVLGPLTRRDPPGPCRRLRANRGPGRVCDEADALVIEATYLEVEAEMAREFGHLTARQAAELAARAGVGHLYPDAHLPPLPGTGSARRGLRIFPGHDRRPRLRPVPDPPARLGAWSRRPACPLARQMDRIDRSPV